MLTAKEFYLSISDAYFNLSCLRESEVSDVKTEIFNFATEYANYVVKWKEENE